MSLKIEGKQEYDYILNVSIILISYTTPIHFYTKQFAPSVFTDNWILKKNIPVQNNLALASS